MRLLSTLKSQSQDWLLTCFMNIEITTEKDIASLKFYFAPLHEFPACGFCLYLMCLLWIHAFWKLLGKKFQVGKLRLVSTYELRRAKRLNVINNVKRRVPIFWQFYNIFNCFKSKAVFDIFHFLVWYNYYTMRFLRHWCVWPFSLMEMCTTLQILYELVTIVKDPWSE